MKDVAPGALTGCLALIGVVVGTYLGGRNSGRQRIRESQLESCQEMMQEYAVVYNWLARFAGGAKPEPIDWAPWNHALTVVSFVCEPKTVATAHALGEQIWRADQAVRQEGIGLEEWWLTRQPVEEARAAFIHAVRRQLNPKFREHVRTTCRPPQDDPMWKVKP
ncbi:hypothetical protein [Cryptosporangium sp. NPDC051539]|uniref:hypothetical protein n=1 Tax=Cryptosporangium sp. NPDC051539 TaxID=3363962 RepID=UPI0037A1E91E